MHKIYISLLFLMTMLLMQFLFSMNAYILIIIIVISFTYIWHVYEQQHMIQNKIENNELLNKINTKSKDASLKNKQLMTVISSIPFPMLLMDEKGMIVMHNSLLDTFVHGEVCNDASYLNNGLSIEVQQFLKDAFISEKKLEQRICVESCEYQAISIPVIAKAKFIGCFIMFQDLTKALEEEKMQKRFIADVSHELKTPIAIIKGMLEILNRKDFDDVDTQKEFLKQMEQEIHRLDHMVKDMLELSRLSVSNPVLHYSKSDISDIMEDCIRSLKETAQQHNVQFETNYQRNEFVFCDPIRIRQVCMNLLMNAITYGGEGIIKAETYIESSFYVIAIQDHGCGIALEEQEKIFDRFYRIDEARARNSGGSGLGLAIVKSIIHAHKGSITVQSTKGKGTTFLIKLNRSDTVLT